MKQKVVRSRKKIKRNRFSRKKVGGSQYLSNVGYSTGYSAPFYKEYVTNIV
jgi:hypothetical protein